MAGGQERILRGRIRSVQATKKITRAMELIAASRIVKAQQRVIAAVPYSDRITEVVRDLSAAGAGSGQPLLAGRDRIGGSDAAYICRGRVCDLPVTGAGELAAALGLSRTTIAAIGAGCEAGS